MDIKIRNATLLDLPSLLEFARSVGRFLCADEIKTWLQVDPDALFVAETSPGGKLIGSCCGTPLAPEQGFMGFYVVLKEYRGKGIGLKLWKAAKEHLGDRNIGVRGDPVNFKKYVEKEGFCHVEDYTILYYECFGDSVSTNTVSSSDIEVATYFEGHLIDCSKKLCKNAVSTDECENHIGSRKTESGSKTTLSKRNIKTNIERPEMSSLAEEQYNRGKSSGGEHADESFPLSVTIEDTSARMKLDVISKSEEILSGVCTFDKLLHKRDRSSIVRQTFSWSTCQTKVALLEGKVAGYASLRQVVTEHWIISPFYADTEDIAEILLFELLQGFDFSQAPKGIQIRFPDKNIACKRLVKKFGFRQNSTLILTGFTKQPMHVDTSKVYSFHSTVFSSE